MPLDRWGCRALAFPPMPTIELTDEEARLTREAIKSMIGDFGREQADLLRVLQSALRKLEEAAPPGYG